MGNKLKWSSKSLSDMDSIYIFIKKENPTAAKRIHKKIDATAHLIEEIQGMGRGGDCIGTLEHPVSKENYTIVYEVIDKIVIILRVLHQSRSLPDYVDDDSSLFSLLH